MSDLKEQAKSIFLDTVRRIDVERLIHSRVRVENETLKLDDLELRLSNFRRIVLIGFGKASLKMGSALEQLLGDRLSAGVLVTDRRHSVVVRSEVIVAGHPLPDANSIKAGAKIIETVRGCGSDCLLIFLISGGASAMVELPIASDIVLDDLRDLNQTLIRSGANIHEINTIRKYLSRIKGGKLGRLARKSTVVALYLSDVNPGDVCALASNPLSPESVTRQDVMEIIKRYDLGGRLRASVSRALNSQSELRGERETDEADNLRGLLLLDNFAAIDAAAAAARSAGFRTWIDYSRQEGHYRDVAEALIEQTLSMKARFPRERVCVVSGGEVSCPVDGDGVGGRNQEFVLYSAARLSKVVSGSDIAVLSCGTDGIDGNSFAAGAVVDQDTWRDASRNGVDAGGFLRRNDSHSFFRRFGGLVVSGPTGNNVRDIRIGLGQSRRT